MEKAVMKNGEDLIRESKVEWEATKGCCWGLSLEPEGSWVSFNAVSHQQTLFMRLQHSCVIRPEKGIKYK